MFNVTIKKTTQNRKKKTHTHTHTQAHNKHTHMYIAKKKKKNHTDIVYEIFSKKYPHSMIV